MSTYYVLKRGKEYWVTGGGEKSIYSVKPSDDGEFNVVREWWPLNDDDAPIREEVVSSHKTRLGAAQKLGRMLKPFTRR